MSYELADEAFSTKDAVKSRCRDIMASTTDGEPVPFDAYPFLFSLFQHHDEWQQKVADGVRSITTQMTPHGTRCFVLVRVDGSTIDISFPHAVKLLPTTRSQSRIPQRLIDYRNAARTAVQDQIRAFRDTALSASAACPVSGEILSRENCAVDHAIPMTFDQLLFDFSLDRKINPLVVDVGSVEGTIATFNDDSLMQDWCGYHRANATLRLISSITNLQLPKPNIVWDSICLGR